MKVKYYVIYDKVANLYYQGNSMWATDIEYAERYINLKTAKIRLKTISRILKSEMLCVLKIKIKEIR